MTIKRFWFIAWVALALSVMADAIAAQPLPVTVEKTDDGWQLRRDGEPYYVNGAGGSASKPALAAAGANSFRTWGVDEGTGPLLDEAHRLGLTVTVGIWLGHERHGFDYSDVDQVAEQYEAARRWVLQYRDHPALLMWAVGNEMEGYEEADDAAIWSAVNNIAEMIQRLDPHHPTMTVIAEVGGKRVEAINRLCPAIDIVGINSYAGVPSIPQRYRQAGGVKPYIVTEYGPPGTWEVGRNDWDAVEEPTSTAKAEFYRRAYATLRNDRELCLGGYAFTWGYKQEATATWFGMVLPGDRKLEAVDVMTRQWSGAWPENRCPRIHPIQISSVGPFAPGQTVKAAVEATDPEGKPLTYRWTLSADPMDYQTGGDAQAAPRSFPEAIGKTQGGEVTLTLPVEPGAYRLFVEVHDPANGAAAANVPLLVRSAASDEAAEVKAVDLPFVIVGDGGESFFIPSGYMGEAGAIDMNPDYASNPRSGETCLRVEYTKPDGWGGVVWQHPANDWGDQPGGRDFTGATKLTFWARGAEGGEKVKFGFGVIGRDKQHFDTARAELTITLTDTWTQYSFDLADRDLRRIKTPFMWVVAGQGGPIRFFLDDVQFDQ